MPIILNGTSGITYPDNTTQTTTAQVVKAWVNFNGTGTVAIRASFNVSSITDNGTGDYTANFTTAFSDTNYCALVTHWQSAAEQDKPSYGSDNTGAYILTNSFRFTIAFHVTGVGFYYEDQQYVYLAVFR